MLQQIILVLHVLVAVAIIALVLVQHGKGADIGATFGGGASNTVFGSQGSGSFLLKLTGFLAIVFFATSLILGYLANSHYKQEQQASKQLIPITRTAPVKTKQNTVTTTKQQSNKVDTK